jgi:hypothetical protein
LFKLGVVAAHDSGRHAFEAVDELGDGHLGRVADMEVDVVGFAVELGQVGLEVLADRPEDRLEVAEMIVVEHPAAVLGDEDQVNVQGEHAVSAVADVLVVGPRPSLG